jgi:hypothetical protein
MHVNVPFLTLSDWSMTSCIYYRFRYIFLSNAKKSNDNAIISPGKYQDNADNGDAIVTLEK